MPQESPAQAEVSAKTETERLLEKYPNSFGQLKLEGAEPALIYFKGVLGDPTDKRESRVFCLVPDKGAFQLENFQQLQGQGLRPENINWEEVNQYLSHYKEPTTITPKVYGLTGSPEGVNFILEPTGIEEWEEQFKDYEEAHRS